MRVFTVCVSYSNGVSCCREWSEACQSKDSSYFSKWGTSQAPEYFYIGCADSRVSVSCQPPAIHTLSSQALGCQLCLAWRRALINGPMPHAQLYIASGLL